MDNETNDVKFQPGFSFKKAYDFPPAWKAENALKQVLGGGIWLTSQCCFCQSTFILLCIVTRYTYGWSHFADICQNMDSGHFVGGLTKRASGTDKHKIIHV